MEKRTLIFFLFVSMFSISACSSDGGAQKIINQSIEFYGMDKLDGKTVSFDFREFHYVIRMNEENYYYERNFIDSTLGKVKDQLTNHGFVREINGLVTPQSQKDSLKYAASVNSVAYFALLPLRLNDEAVKKKFIKSVMVNGKEYDEIEVSFEKENGGKDHNDVFYYWFDAADHSMDFLAYSEGGNRFRAINGLIKVGDFYFQNYINLTAKKADNTPLQNYDKLFEQDKLVKLSEIIIRNVKVE